MSPQNRLLEEVQFTLSGHHVVAYVPFGWRHGDWTAPSEPVRWWIKVDEGPAFHGPAYRGQTIAESVKAEAELRAFLEGNPRVREIDG